MSTYKFIQCDICNIEGNTVSIVKGWDGWRSVSGVQNDTGEKEIHLCPDCGNKQDIFLRQLMEDKK